MTSLSFIVWLVLGATTTLIIIAAGPTTGLAFLSVRNDLNSSKFAVIVHCQSKDDNLKAHVVQFGSGVDWNFEPGSSTLFWCDLALQDKRLHFDAFQEKPADFGGYCWFTEWVVIDAGVYRESTLCHERDHKHIKIMRSLLFLVPLIFGATSILIIITAGPSMARDMTVGVKNGLSSELAVIVHCQSKNDDLKAHVVQVGSQIQWSFGFYFATLFWCDLALQDKRLSFNAFRAEDHHYGTPDRGKDIYWVVKNDGVYKNDSTTLFASWTSF
ncbi:S-protein homolog 74 [Linum grandiflorum]